ncbi:MAG: PulJ/GspJ family protein, partial [Planctomycetota bacterium]
MEIKNWKLARRGFTIVELLVAMSLLVILLALSGVVFDTTVKAHRAAGATIDVTRNLRAITDQLNADFRGLQKDAPLTIWFELDSATGQRYDQIQFFADGDFQTTRQYFNGTADMTVSGNMARIYYGHAWLADMSTGTANPFKGYRQFLIANGDSVNLAPGHLFARRTHLFTNDPALPLYSNGTNPSFPYVDWPNTLFFSFLSSLNNYYEYDQLITLNQWKQLFSIQANCDEYLATCFNNEVPPGDNTLAGRIGRPVIDMANINYLHNLLSQGVIQMQVQWAYTVEDLTIDAVAYVPIPAANYFAGIRWWPSENPDADNTT